MDRRNEKLSGVDAFDAFSKCFNCENLTPCRDNNWVITCDKDGVTCDNYKPLPKPPEVEHD